MMMTPGDVVDRWTITRMKYRATKPNPELLKVLDELDDEVQVAWERATVRGKYKMFHHALTTLIEINAKIWKDESFASILRSREPIDIGLIGTIGLEITEENRVRVKAIDTINNMLGEKPCVGSASTPTTTQPGQNGSTDLRGVVF